MPSDTATVIADLYLRNKRLEQALKTIADWRLPTITSHNGGAVSYGVAYGSNGERDWVKDLARCALYDQPHLMLD